MKRAPGACRPSPVIRRINVRRLRNLGIINLRMPAQPRFEDGLQGRLSHAWSVVYSGSKYAQTELSRVNGVSQSRQTSVPFDRLIQAPNVRENYGCARKEGAEQKPSCVPGVCPIH